MCETSYTFVIDLEDYNKPVFIIANDFIDAIYKAKEVGSYECYGAILKIARANEVIL